MLEVCAIFLAGIWAGAINTIVGSGTLVTFPTLLLFGYPPLVANVSNNIGLVGGGITGIHGYRHELRPNRSLLVQLAPASILGGLVGALLLLVLPESSFKTIVPALIALGLLMVVVGPAIQRRAARRTAELGHGTDRSAGHRAVLTAGVFALGIYGGYFGAAQGILLIGLMSMLLSAGIQRLNAIKNVLATLVNAVAAATFVVVARDQIDWRLVGLIAGGSLIGGHFGARVGRRLPPVALRALILAIGSVALIKIVFFG